MSFSQKAGITAAVVAQAMAALMFARFVYYLIAYLADVDGLRREEYLFAGWSMLLYALGLTLASAVLALLLRRTVASWQFRALAWPAVVLGACFAVLYVYSAASMLA